MLIKCSKCEEEKPATKEFFYESRGKLKTECKKCTIKYVTEHKRLRRKLEGDRPYYIYEWFFVDTGKPFYIGKGRGRRYREKRDRSHVFRNYVNKFKCSSRIIISGLSEQEAYEKEIEVISRYKKQGIHLINKTGGGDAPPKLEGFNHPHRKAVVQLSLNGEFIRKWDVLSDVEKELGIANNLIVKSCKNKSRTGNKPSAGGFLWVYEDEYDPNIKYFYKRGTVAKPILQYGLDGKFIREWESAKEAALALGVERTTLCGCLKGRYFTCGGYQWRFKKDGCQHQIPPIDTNDHYMQIAINRTINKRLKNA